MTTNQIGFYEFEQTIGKGKFAIVKLARHIMTQRRVAIKVVDKRRLDADALNRANREIQILKVLRGHPHIVSLYQVFETDKRLFLVTQWASGGEIFDHLAAHGRMSEGETRRLFRQLVSALSACHEHNIVHRDIKAENVLLDANRNLLLADFGFSTEYSSMSNLLQTWCGSPPYTAPELFAGVPYDGRAADCWSAGVVLYVLLCGSLPFDAPNLTQLRSHVSSGVFYIPFYVSDTVADLLRGLLNVNPTERLTVSQIAVHPWVQPIPEINWSNTFELNESVLNQIQDMGFDAAQVAVSVQNRAFDANFAVYYLLCEKEEEEEEQPSPEALVRYLSMRRRTLGDPGTVTPSPDLLLQKTPLSAAFDIRRASDGARLISERDLKGHFENEESHLLSCPPSPDSEGESATSSVLPRHHTIGNMLSDSGDRLERSRKNSYPSFDRRTRFRKLYRSREDPLCRLHKSFEKIHLCTPKDPPEETLSSPEPLVQDDELQIQRILCEQQQLMALQCIYVRNQRQLVSQPLVDPRAFSVFNQFNPVIAKTGSISRGIPITSKPVGLQSVPENSQISNCHSGGGLVISPKDQLTRSHSLSNSSKVKGLQRTDSSGVVNTIR